jgi:integral membrane protein (TIGR01906 family)
VNLEPLEWAAAVVAAAGTAAVIVAVSVLLFLNPVWVSFEQDRSGVTQLTGYSATEVRNVTGAILSDLIFGPGTFDVAVNGQPVLDVRERSHMADVRGVFGAAGLAALAAAVLLAAAALYGRGRSWFWQATATGAKVLIGAVIGVGIVLGIFFDQVFELFHRLFFASGSYTFDSRTEKLVQLFPDQFWFETSLALAVAIVAIAVVVMLGTGAMVRRSASWSATGTAP